jgi:hypothetical protein
VHQLVNKQNFDNIKMHGTNVKMIGHKQLGIFQATREKQISYKQIAYVLYVVYISGFFPDPCDYVLR